MPVKETDQNTLGDKIDLANKNLITHLIQRMAELSSRLVSTYHLVNFAKYARRYLDG